MCPGPQTAHLEYDKTRRSEETPAEIYCHNWYNFLFDRALVETLEMADQVSDPEEAELFFVPAYLVSDQTAHMYTYSFKPEHRDYAWFKRRDAEIVQFLRTVGPYWDRHGGADHLVTSLACTSRGGPVDTMYPQLWNNTLRACLEEGIGLGFFNNTKAIKVPYYADPSFRLYKPPIELPPNKRSISIFFTGSLIDDRRSWVNETFAKIPDAMYLPFVRGFYHQTNLINISQ